MSRYVKVLFGNKSDAGDGFRYDIGKVNVSDTWNPSEARGKDCGGFNFTLPQYILRWLHRGDTLYDVTVPEDAELVRYDFDTPFFRANKIIVSDPVPIDDNLALKLYGESDLTDRMYYRSLAIVSMMGYEKTAERILSDWVNADNIEDVMAEWNRFIYHDGTMTRFKANPLVREINKQLVKIWL